MVAQVDARYRAFGWTRYLRRLASYAMFEGRPLTTKGQFINPLVLAWLRLLGWLPGRPQVRGPIFITGLGRSGTTILGVLLSLHRQLGFLNEPKAMWHVIEPRQDLLANYIASGGVYRLGSSDVTERAVRTAHRLFARYLSLVNADRAVDKYPEMIFRVDYLLRLFPDAHIVFITRSGVDAVPSVVQWSERLGVRRNEDVEDWWGLNDTKWRYLVDQLLLTDPALAGLRDLNLTTLDHVNRAALEWTVSMREGLRQARAHPDRVIRVSYEALLQDPAGELESLQRRCGLTPDADVVAYARHALYANPTKPWPTLLPEVEVLFRRTMEELGYAD